MHPTLYRLDWHWTDGGIPSVVRSCMPPRRLAFAVAFVTEAQASYATLRAGVPVLTRWEPLLLTDQRATVDYTHKRYDGTALGADAYRS